MELFGHIAERFIIHFASATFLVLLAFMLLRSARRRYFLAGEWLPESWRSTLVLAALLIFAGSALREAYDVSVGGALAKSVSDYVSWSLGCGCAAWGLHRLVKEANS